jgi:subtilisin family serine protease
MFRSTRVQRGTPTPGRPAVLWPGAAAPGRRAASLATARLLTGAWLFLAAIAALPAPVSSAGGCSYDDRVATILGYLQAAAREAPQQAGVQQGAPLPSVASVATFDGGHTAGLLVEGDVLPAALEALGARIGARVATDTPGRGPWITAIHLPLERVPALLFIAGVRHLEGAGRNVLHLDVSGPALKADLVHNASGTPPVYAGLSGQGVVVGVVDSGVDPGHQDFRDGLGNDRLYAAWDQMDFGASPGPPSGFAYGTGWTSAQLSAGTARLMDTDGHGTHVTGIAAGSGRATGNSRPAYRFIGVAPEATIVAVKTNLSDTGILDGVRYVFQQATSLALPAVVNLSLGSQFGPHDGTGSLEVALDALVGPGRVIVASAGNEGAAAIHAKGNAAGSGVSLVANVAAYTPQGGAGNDDLEINAWARDQASVRVSVLSPNSIAVGPVVKGTSSTANLTADGRIEILNGVGGVQPNGMRSITIRIYDSVAAQPPRAGNWTFTFVATAGGATEQVDAWIYLDTIAGSGEASFTAGRDALGVVGSPATASKVIAVASYVSKRTWSSIDGNNYQYNPLPTLGALSTFSSNGPRRDGVLKPEIAAPGQGIISSLSSAVTRSPQIDPLVEPDGQHWLLQGTSQAGPHVAGTVALMLERFPNMNAALAKQYLECGGQTDAQTGATPNVAWGYGKLDAQRAVGNCLVPAVTLLDFSARPQPGGVRVQWRLPEAGTLTQLLLQRRDGQGDYALVQALPAAQGEGAVFDPTPLAGRRTYRMLGATPQSPEQWLGEVAVSDATSAPARLTLAANVPNPFNPATLIPFTLPAAGAVDLSVFDARGRRVRTLLHERRPAGAFSTVFDGRDDAGSRLGSGVYQVRLEAAGSVRARAVTMVQ